MIKGKTETDSPLRSQAFGKVTAELLTGMYPRITLTRPAERTGAGDPAPPALT